jgi:hypothetical protein
MCEYNQSVYASESLHCPPTPEIGGSESDLPRSRGIRGGLLGKQNAPIDLIKSCSFSFGLK